MKHTVQYTLINKMIKYNPVDEFTPILAADFIVYEILNRAEIRARVVF